MNLSLTFIDLIEATMRQYGIGPVEAVTVIKGALDQALAHLQSTEVKQP